MGQLPHGKKVMGKGCVTGAFALASEQLGAPWIDSRVLGSGPTLGDQAGSCLFLVLSGQSLPRQGDCEEHPVIAL